MEDRTAFKATNDPDAMCYHEEMKALDRGESINAMSKEVEDHADHSH